MESRSTRKREMLEALANPKLEEGRRKAKRMDRGKRGT